MTGFSAMLALLMVLAIQRVPSAERIVVEKPTIQEAQFDAAWADSFQTAVAKRTDAEVRRIEMTRPTTLASSEQPKPVVTERIMPDAPAKAPPVILVDDEESTERPAARRHHRIRTASADESNVCTRHKMHKVVTRGGKSWRCRR